MSTVTFFLDLTPVAALLPALALRGQRETNYALMREVVKRLPGLPRLDVATPQVAGSMGVATGVELDDLLIIVWTWEQPSNETILTARWVGGQLTAATLQIDGDLLSLTNDSGVEARLEPQEVAGPRQTQQLERIDAEVAKAVATIQAGNQPGYCENCGRDYAAGMTACQFCEPADLLLRTDGYFEEVQRRTTEVVISEAVPNAAELTLLPLFKTAMRKVAAKKSKRAPTTRAKSDRKDNEPAAPKKPATRKRKKRPD